MIDLRSDTLTRPCEAMRQAMANAEVNDDVIDIDPTVQRLQDKIAELLGKEAALFMPSGTMTNQVSVRLHCKPGDELICEEGCHIYNYEQGAYASLSGIAVRTVQGELGILEVDQLEHLIRPFDEHAPQTKLVCLENTHNRAGGRILPIDSINGICDWAHGNGLIMHLDGARLFNAVVAAEISAADYAEPFDTVSVCFSKGLGAPVGSALIGSEESIAEMRRHRKLFGGGMRQSGIIAAGALFALENNIERLADDHDTAQILARQISEFEGLSVDPTLVDTNIVLFEVDSNLCSAPDFCEQLLKAGVWTYPFSHRLVRAVTHLHITAADARQAAQIVGETASAIASMA